MCRALRDATGRVINVNEPVVTVQGATAIWRGYARIEKASWWEPKTYQDLIEITEFWEHDARTGGLQNFEMKQRTAIKCAITRFNVPYGLETLPTGSLVIWTQPTQLVNPDWLVIHDRMPIMINLEAA